MTVEHLIVGLLGVTLTAGVAFGLRLDAKIDRANDRIDDAAKDLKEDARVAHAEIGSNIRRVEETFNARFDDLRDYIKLALKTRRAPRCWGRFATSTRRTRLRTTGSWRVRTGTP